MVDKTTMQLLVVAAYSVLFVVILVAIRVFCPRTFKRMAALIQCKKYEETPEEQSQATKQANPNNVSDPTRAGSDNSTVADTEVILENPTAASFERTMSSYRDALTRQPTPPWFTPDSSVAPSEHEAPTGVDQVPPEQPPDLSAAQVMSPRNLPPRHIFANRDGSSELRDDMPSKAQAPASIAKATGDDEISGHSGGQNSASSNLGLLAEQRLPAYSGPSGKVPDAADVSRPGPSAEAAAVGGVSSPGPDDANAIADDSLLPLKLPGVFLPEPSAEDPASGPSAEDSAPGPSDEAPADADVPPSGADKVAAVAEGAAVADGSCPVTSDGAPAGADKDASRVINITKLKTVLDLALDEVE